MNVHDVPPRRTASKHQGSAGQGLRPGKLERQDDDGAKVLCAQVFRDQSQSQGELMNSLLRKDAGKEALGGWASIETLGWDWVLQEDRDAVAQGLAESGPVTVIEAREKHVAKSAGLGGLRARGLGLRDLREACPECQDCEEQGAQEDLVPQYGCGLMQRAHAAGR